MRRTHLVIATVAALALMAGCASTASPPEERAPGAASVPVAAPSAGEADGAVDVLMLGRSVMGGWMAHLGSDGSTPVERGGYTLEYGELSSPPDIASSAIARIADATPGSVVVFKHCFVDFEAPDAGTAASVLARNKAAVGDVADAAEERDVRLVVGTSLPQVRSASSLALVEQHRAYDGWLRSEAQRRGFAVLDLNSTLAGPDGALRPEYAASPDDAHLNEAAYAELDTRLFDLLDEVTR